ncbi:hypothetical protein A1507_22845, partial [Methylomonas koyamae]
MKSQDRKRAELEKLEALTKPVTEKAVKQARKHGSTSAPTKAGKPQASCKTIYRRLDSVKSKPIDWLWPGRIACGKVTLIAGDPGLGKSQITAALAGIVTTGGLWPVDKDKSPQGAVLFLSAEDDAADTIRPRLEAVDADLSRCIVVDAIVDTDEAGTIRQRSISLKSDLSRLEAVIKDIGEVRLIIIDPITAYLGGIDSHKTSDVRDLLAPLATFAERHKVAILGISHLNKSNTQDALLRVNGSLAFVAAARAAFIAVKDKNNPARRLLLPLKNNLAKDVGGFAFSIVDCTLDNGLNTSRIEWEPDPVNMTADEAMNAKPAREESGAVDEARQFLLDLLSIGPMASSDVKDEAEKAGFSWATIRRAKENGGIESKKSGFDNGWIWSLSEDAHTKMLKPGACDLSA